MYLHVRMVYDHVLSKYIRIFQDVISFLVKHVIRLSLTVMLEIHLPVVVQADEVEAVVVADEVLDTVVMVCSDRVHEKSVM